MYEELELITLETALLLKEKGFEMKCENGFNKSYLTESHDITIDRCNANLIERPTQTTLQSWLREIKGIEVYCRSDGFDKNKKYVSFIINHGCTEIFKDIYEEGLEIGLQKALSYIK